jgi:hypothetical protein
MSFEEWRQRKRLEVFFRATQIRVEVSSFRRGVVEVFTLLERCAADVCYDVSVLHIGFVFKNLAV